MKTMNLKENNLIIECDIGHDPDDFFTLCYLHSAGVNIRAIVVSPGHQYQLAIVRAFCKEVGLDIPIGYAKKDEGDKSYTKSFHQNVITSMGYAVEDAGDSFGRDIIAETLQNFPDCEIFICGPLLNLGGYFDDYPHHHIKKVTMQGGFLPYDQHSYGVEVLKNFMGKSTVPTFNLNGSKKQGIYLAEKANIDDLRFVGKNVCHTIIYDRERHDWIKEVEPKDKAQEIFVYAMDKYLEKHSEKKFHDPTAAVCHLHPEIGIWIQGKLYNSKGEWGSYAMEGTNTHLLADINRDKLWNYIRSGE